MSMSINAAGSGAVQGFDPTKIASKIAAKMMGDLDPTNSGSVSKDTFVSTLTAKGLSSVDATKMYDSIDTKQSGGITKTDIESAIKSGSLKPPVGGPPGGAGRPNVPDGAGAPGGPAGAGKASASTSADAYEVEDTNEDGTVSAQEALLYALKSETSADLKTTDALGQNIDTTA